MRTLFRRGWWKPWSWSTRKWLVVILVFAVTSPLLTRWAFLWQVPDVALPFDVEDVIRAPVPVDDDAFVKYATVVKKLRSQFVEWSSQAIDDAIYPSIEKWDDRLDDWLVKNSEALADYRSAGEMDRAGGPSLKTADVTAMLTVHNDVRYLAKLAEVEAIRCERSGDMEAAWTWHRANLNCARHSEMPGFAICRLVAIAVRGHAFAGIARWAQCQSLTAERLHAARSELSQQLARRMSLIDVAKAEYLVLRNTLNRPDVPNVLLPKLNSGAAYEPQLVIGKRWFLWSIGEPERTLRLKRQVLLNNLDQIDKDPNVRSRPLEPSTSRPINDPQFYELVFELGPQIRRRSRQLEPTDLQKAFKNPIWQLGQQSGFFGSRQVDGANRRENARFAAINVLLASHEYQRIHGEFPASIERLVPTFLQSIPFDPMDPNCGKLQYRRDENGEAIVWSIGQDETDDDGDVESIQCKDIGFRIRVRK